MGTRLINSSVPSHHNKYRSGDSAPLAYKMEIAYDGGGAHPFSPHLPANEIWIDASSLFRQGLNLGPSIQYLDSDAGGTVDVYGMLSSREYAKQVVSPDYSFLPGKLLPNWVPLRLAMTAGFILTDDTKIYDLYRFVFSTGIPANIIMMSL